MRLPPRVTRAGLSVCGSGYVTMTVLCLIAFLYTERGYFAALAVLSGGLAWWCLRDQDPRA